MLITKESAVLYPWTSNKKSIKIKPTFASYLTGVYLFSVPTFSYSADLELNFIPQVIGLLLVLYAIIDYLYTRRLNMPHEIRVYGCFIAWLVFTFFLAGNLNYCDSLISSIKVCIITLCITQLTKSEEDFFNALSIYGLSILFVAYLKYDTILYLSMTSRITGMDRFEGTISNANLAAIYAISISWVSLLLMQRPSTKLIMKFLSVIVASTAIIIIIFSGSIKGLVGISLMAFYLGWLILRKKRHSYLKRSLLLFISIGFICGTIYLITISPFFFRLEALMDIEGTVSGAERLYLFKAALRVWLDNGINFFFGIGHDNFRDYNNLAVYSHSTISEILASAGIIGFFLYFGAIGLLFFNFWVKRKSLHNTSKYVLSSGCILFIIIFIFFNTTAVLYSDRGLWPLMGMLASYSILIAKPNSKWLITRTKKLYDENSVCYR